MLAHLGCTGTAHGSAGEREGEGAAVVPCTQLGEHKENAWGFCRGHLNIVLFTNSMESSQTYICVVSFDNCNRQTRQYKQIIDSNIDIMYRLLSVKFV